MERPRATIVLVFVAIAVAAWTAVEVTTLPSPGAIRYSATDPRSALSQAIGSLRAVGITTPYGAIQEQIRPTTNPLGFRAATYWTSADVASRRDDYLAAGCLIVLTLLLGATLLAFV